MQGLAVPWEQSCYWYVEHWPIVPSPRHRGFDWKWCFSSRAIIQVYGSSLNRHGAEEEILASGCRWRICSLSYKQLWPIIHVNYR